MTREWYAVLKTVLGHSTDPTRRLFQLLPDDVSHFNHGVFNFPEAISKSCCHLAGEFHTTTQKVVAHWLRPVETCVKPGLHSSQGVSDPVSTTGAGKRLKLVMKVATGGKHGKHFARL